MLLAVVVVVFSLIFERQLVAQGRGQSQQAGSTGPGGQRGLQACRMGRERDGYGVAVGEVLSLELLLLKHTQNKNKLIKTSMLIEHKQVSGMKKRRKKKKNIRNFCCNC